MRYFYLIFCLFLMACGSGSPQNAPLNSATLGQASGVFADLLNGFRSQQNRGPVRANGRLAAIAQSHAQDMAREGVLSHRGSNGSTLRQRVERGGYGGCLWAENIAEGYPTEAAVFKGWQTSPGHRRNMLLAGAQDYGLARVGSYWVLVLAAPC